MKGKPTLSSMGIVDNRIFKGEARVHVKRDAGLWSVYIEKGLIPDALFGQKWTRWENCLADVTRYFKSRNLEVTEVIE